MAANGNNVIVEVSKDPTTNYKKSNLKKINSVKRKNKPEKNKRRKNNNETSFKQKFKNRK